jgi:hypothetical protein
MAISTPAGTQHLVSAAAPATQDAAGYAALTYTKVGYVEKLGPIGANTSKVEFQPLEGAKMKLKGSTDYGALQPNLAHDEADAGQSIIRTASAPTNISMISNKVIYPTGAIRYFQTIVFGYPESVEGADTVLTAMPVLEIVTPIVKVAPT